MKKLLLSAIMAVSAFAVVSSIQSQPNSCGRCAITEEVGCTPKPICEKQIVVTKNACPILTCTRQCSYGCPVGFKEAGIDASANNEDAFADVKSSKAARRSHAK